MKTRFKTKQELVKKFGDLSNPNNKHCWTPEGRMDYLFGLPWNGGTGTQTCHKELTNCDYSWFIHDHHLTTAPHPYFDRKILIFGHKGKMQKTLQEKAFALGYRWVEVENNTGTEVIRDECDLLYLHPDKHLTRSSFDLNDSHNNDFMKLTPTQFMEGDLPLDDVTEFMRYCESDVADASEGKKPDAYIVNGLNYHTVKLQIEGCYSTTQVGVKALCTYNLMSEEEFKVKHSPKLKFKEWEIKVEDKIIRVGCETFRKQELEQWMKTNDAILAREDVTLADAFEFLDKHKKELGLDF